MLRALQNFVQLLAFLGRRILNFLNWRLIRAIGQLQILTRASYIMLLVVPLLAGMWPAVRVYVNQHNKKAAELTITVEQAKARFDETQKELAPTVANLLAVASPPSTQENALRQDLETTLQELKDTVNGFNATVDAFITDFAERTLKDPKLPWSFAAAFFAALFVVLGHLVYQLCAPDVIKAQTLDEFVSSRKDDYARHPSEDALTRAKEFSRTRLGERAKLEEDYEAHSLLRRLEELTPDEWLAELRSLRRGRLMSLATFLRDHPGPREFERKILEVVERILGGTSGEAQYEDMTLIERGAKAEYLYSATKVAIAIFMTACLYAVAVFVLLLIIKVQTRSVMEAAGWSSITSLFSS